MNVVERHAYFDKECTFYNWITLIRPCMETITKSQPPNKQTYRIFSIKRPRSLFQALPGGPCVYLKPARNRGPAFI